MLLSTEEETGGVAASVEVAASVTVELSVEEEFADESVRVELSADADESVTVGSSAETVESVAVESSAEVVADGSVIVELSPEAIIDGSVESSPEAVSDGSVELSPMLSPVALTSVPLVEDEIQEQVDTSAVVPKGHVPSAESSILGYFHAREQTNQNQREP
jgi:hypothetical protein